MTQPIYEVLTFVDNSTILQRTNEDGTLSFIPMDEANSDYQAYLNKDKAEQSTPMVADE
jgi:hypothetical protein